MWISKTDRKGLLDFIQTCNPNKIQSIEESNYLNLFSVFGDDLLLIWSDKFTFGSYLPELICVADSKEIDFLAWASTYLKAFRPFTAFCRVLEISSFELLQKQAPIQIDTKCESAFLGAIIGEMNGLLANGELKHQNTLAATSTFSFAMSRACIHDIPLDKWNISQRYTKVRDLVGKQRSSTQLKLLDEIWKILSAKYSNNHISVHNLTSEGQLIADSFSDIIQTGEIQPFRWLELIKSFTNIPYEDVNLTDNREIRVAQFDKLMTSLSSESNVNPLFAGFVSGYLANKIAPGTFKHNDLLKPFVARFPSLFVWYGICAGLSSNNEVHAYNSSLGWRITRDLLQKEPIWQRPHSDISIEELEILLSTEHPDLSFNRESHTHLKVEIAPSVYTIVSWPPHDVKSEAVNRENTKKQLELFRESSNQSYSQDILSELGLALADVFLLYEKYTGKKITLDETDKRKSKYRKNKSKADSSKKDKAQE